jgi:hypothetical protein
MHPLEESCYAGFELCKELVCSRPPLKNAGELHDMLLEIKDILRVLGRRLESCEQSRRDVAQSVVLAFISAVFASSRKPPIAPFRPGIGTPSKVFSRTQFESQLCIFQPINHWICGDSQFGFDSVQFGLHSEVKCKDIAGSVTVRR